MPQADTLILIPPSEGKTPGGAGKPVKPGKAQQEMNDRLHNYDGDWGKLLGVKGKALDEAIEVNQSVLEAPTMPAIERYSGVVYDGIDYPGLSKDGRQFFDRHVRVVSALFGLLKPKESIPNYKLKIEKLDAANYWQPIIAKALRNKFVIDVLPKAHQKAVRYEDGIVVDFIVEKNGKRKPAGHHGKRVKGRFVRWLCENGVVSPDDFAGFDEDGFKWDGEVFFKKEQ